MRLFFASFANARAKELLERKSLWLQQQLPSGIKWVKPKNFHITLKFLGDTDEEKAKLLKENLQETDFKLDKFPYKYQGLEVFPHKNNPRVIVTPVKLGKNKLTQIYEVLEDISVNLGFEKDDRKFKPHLTLGRVKNDNIKNDVNNFFSELSEEYFINILDHMEKLSLVESNLTPEGPEYMEVFSKKFK